MRERVLHLGFEIAEPGSLVAERVQVFGSVHAAAVWVMQGERRYYAKVQGAGTPARRIAPAVGSLVTLGEGRHGGRKASGRRGV